MLGDDTVEGLDVLERAAHEDRVAHAHAVIAEDAHPRRGVGHGPELGEALALQSHRHRTHRVHIAVASLHAPAPDHLDDACRVRHGSRVGHGVHRGEPAQGRSRGAGGDGFGILPARLAQMRVQVDEPGQRHGAMAVDHRCPGIALGCGASGTDVRDDAIAPGDVDRVFAVGADIAQDRGHSPASSWTSAAPRSR